MKLYERFEMSRSSVGYHRGAVPLVLIQHILM